VVADDINAEPKSRWQERLENLVNRFL